MSKLTRYFALSAAVLVLSFALPAQAGAVHTAVHTGPSAAAPAYYLRAQVIPAESTAVGSSPLTGGSGGAKSGESLWANGVNANWLTGSYTIYFLVLTMSSHPETGKVLFKVISPSQATVYSYSFPSEQVPQGVSWYAFAAKANYAKPGLYFAEWYFGSTLDGWAPLNFTA